MINISFHNVKITFHHTVNFFKFYAVSIQSRYDCGFSFLELFSEGFDKWAWTGPRNHELDGGPDPPWQVAIFGERVAHWKV